MNLVERLVVMPPYVEPEHRPLIEQAEKMLHEYETHLLEKVAAELFDNGWSLNPHPIDIKESERRYHEDPMRAHLLKQLVHLKSLCERPRFRLKALESAS